MHSVDIAKKDKYLHVSHEGVVTAGSLRGVISNTIQAVVYHNCYTVLIDYRKAILQVSSFNMVEYMVNGWPKRKPLVWNFLQSRRLTFLVIMLGLRAISGSSKPIPKIGDRACAFLIVKPKQLPGLILFHQDDQLSWNP